MAASTQRFQFDPAFEILYPAQIRAPVLFNSPHSGRNYPADFLQRSKLDALTLRRSEDAYVDELFGEVVAMGAPLMRAHFPRAYVDLNREPYELDPDMFAEPLPVGANTGSLRVAGGLGTIPRVVAESAEIYAEPLALAEAEARIEHLYKPYHGDLKAALADIRRAFGAALLVDCHSMPSQGRDRRQIRPDVILGDRFGMACAPEFVETAERTLRGLGLSVVRNRPYAGGFIAQRYGLPTSGVHALQVEVNRALYMNERSLEKTRGFDGLKRHLVRLAADLMEAANTVLGVGRLAAE
jgi:N-formylglutamate amidohydrolase